MEIEMELTIASINLSSKNCRNSAMEAIQFAKEGNFAECEEALNNASLAFLEAEKTQSDLIRKEAGGENLNISLLLVYSESSLVASGAIKDLAKEFVDLYKRL